MSEGAQHLRNIKTGIKGTFSGFTGVAVTATAARKHAPEDQLNQITANTMTTTLKMRGYGISGLSAGSGQ